MTDFKASPLLNTSTPGVTLTWNNLFDSIPPSQFNLSVQSSSEDVVSYVKSLDPLDLVLANVEEDYSYEINGLLFHTSYDFELIALYSVTGDLVSSEPVTISYTTEQGGRYICNIV